MAIETEGMCEVQQEASEAGSYGRRAHDKGPGRETNQTPALSTDQLNIETTASAR